MQRPFCLFLCKSIVHLKEKKARKEKKISKLPTCIKCCAQDVRNDEKVIIFRNTSASTSHVDHELATKRVT